MKRKSISCFVFIFTLFLGCASNETVAVKEENQHLLSALLVQKARIDSLQHIKDNLTQKISEYDAMLQKFVVQKDSLGLELFALEELQDTTGHLEKDLERALQKKSNLQLELSILKKRIQDLEKDHRIEKKRFLSKIYLLKTEIREAERKLIVEKQEKISAEKLEKSAEQMFLITLFGVGGLWIITILVSYLKKK